MSREIPNDIIPTDPMRNAVCSLGVGCDEYGVCYAEAHGQPDQCGMPRRGDWIQTFTGVAFYPLDPRTHEVRIEDIAHALAHQCRYGGHTNRFYSVAEHCCHLATYAPTDLKFIALMHDAAEAYLVDVPRPIKKSLTVYYEIEAGLERVIAERFGLQHPWHPDVMVLDTRICTDERQHLMATPPIAWSGGMPALGVDITGWGPRYAEQQFLKMFESLKP